MAVHTLIDLMHMTSEGITSLANGPLRREIRQPPFLVAKEPYVASSLVHGERITRWLRVVVPLDAPIVSTKTVDYLSTDFLLILIGFWSQVVITWN